MNKAILLGGVAAVALAGTFFLMGGGEDAPEAVPEAVVAEPEKTIKVAALNGIGDVFVAGPCEEGNRGNNIFPLEGKPASDCYIMTSDGQDYLDVRKFAQSVYVRVSNGSDTLLLGGADDVIDVRGSFEMVLDAGGGDNVLNMSGLAVSDVSMRVDGEDIIVEGKRGWMRLRKQYPREGEAAPIQKMIFENQTLSASEIYFKSVDGQATDGDDNLSGTPQDDLIYPGLGNDVIAALEGDDSIHYEGGHDTIMGSYEGRGEDTLMIPFDFDQVFLENVDNRDMKIIVPGGSITLQFQIFFPLGDERSNIERFVFKDGIYSDADLRAALESGEKAVPPPDRRRR